MSTSYLIGPFREMVTMRNLPSKGALKDAQLDIIQEGGLLIQDGHIAELGNFKALKKAHREAPVQEIVTDLVAFPGLIDAHTHLCFAGSRAMDFAERNAGTTYQEIAARGGGIWSSVRQTRVATSKELIELTFGRMNQLVQQGVTTVEIKSGYGLDHVNEIKILQAIKEAAHQHPIEVMATCLAAHIIPKEFDGDEKAYLHYILQEILPDVISQKLAKRFDIFIEDNAFTPEPSAAFLRAVKSEGFDLCVHGDQFTTGGSAVAIEVGALSVDHLEASTDIEIQALSKSNVIPMALPGASIGIGCAFTPARKLLDAGCSLAIASDWNPGSAPQGDLLTQASILATFEKLSSAEVWAGITVRAAQALNLSDRGVLDLGKRADIAAFPTTDYREVLYHQGQMRPAMVWIGGDLI
ncbi:MAG: imidazolonepropionase [Bacteroidota bacterium]